MIQPTIFTIQRIIFMIQHIIISAIGIISRRPVAAAIILAPALYVGYQEYISANSIEHILQEIRSDITKTTTKIT
jgi:hypothetical protein